MTYATAPSRTAETTRHPSVFDLSRALLDGSTPDSPAALTEALLPEIKRSSWLLISSNAVIDAPNMQVVNMILERAIPSGVSVALDLDWQPERWHLPPQSPPSAEVLRRIQPLAWAAQLIHCSSEEAESFFASTDPAQVHRHDTLPQRPAVLISTAAGGLDWCIGGRRGSLNASMLQDHGVFLTRLLENLATSPQLLGNAAPGLDAVADADGLTEQLLKAAMTSANPAQAGS